MKLLHVICGAEQGGAETFFLDGVLALDEAGVEQWVVLRPNNPHRIEQLKARGIPVFAANFNQYWRRPTRRIIESAIAHFQPQVIQYWMGRAGTFAPEGLRERNVGWYGGYYKLSRFSNCDHHLAVTGDIVRHIVDQGADPRNVGLIHTFAEMEDAPPMPRAEFDTPEDAPLLVALARLHWKKGLDVLLNAMPKIPGAYLWIAGDGPLREPLETEAKLLGVEDRVRFLGWRNDRAALLAAADVCVFPSRYEPFGTVTIEAWAAGIPLVAAKAQGPRAYVRNGHNGLLVNVDDVDGLATAVRRVLSDHELRLNIVRGGRRTYEERFTKEVFVRESLAFYDKVADTAALSGTPYPEISHAAKLREIA